MKTKIIAFLTEHPSFLKWGNERLASKFGCAPRTIKTAKRVLKDVKKEYLSSL